MGEVRALKTFQTCKQYNTIQPCLTQHLLLWNHNTVILPRFMFGLSPYVLTFKWSEHDSQHWNLGQLDDWLHYVAPLQLWFRDVDFLSLSTNDNAWWIIKSPVAQWNNKIQQIVFSGATNHLGWAIPEGQRGVVYFSNRLNMLHSIHFSDDGKILVFVFPPMRRPFSRPVEIRYWIDCDICLGL